MNLKNIPRSELERQKFYMEKIKLLNEGCAKTDGVAPKAVVSTFGCQMNAHDSEKIIGILSTMGYTITDSEETADLIIYNTCCIRENAENKVYGNLGYLKHYKKAKPNLKIALCGCMMQQPSVVETIKKKYRHVDIIFGTFNFYRLAELLYSSLETNKMIIDIWETHKEILEDLPSIRAYKHKAAVNIMYGCNNFCSYCIVPYVRGRERSRTPDEIISEVQALAEDGVCEIMLLGQNVNSYGKYLSEKVSFAELLKEISAIDKIRRIRFMTSHPKDLTDDLIYTIRDYPNICKHIHLPLQSGSSYILEKMNRKYTKEEYLSLAEKIRNEIPGVSITTDIIVGFPGETEEDFKDTIDVVERVMFNSAFTFLYSERKGTPAVNIEPKVALDVAKRRFNSLLETLNTIAKEQSDKMLGQRFGVYVEGISAKDKNILTGRTDNNTLVHFKGDKDLIGQLVTLEIIDNKTFYLIGEKVIN